MVGHHEIAANTDNLLILVPFFRGVPESLEESAIVDGAGHFRILWSIFLPNPDRWPVSLVLREIIIVEQMSDYMGGIDVGDQRSVAETIKHATAVVTTLPVLLLYPYL